MEVVHHPYFLEWFEELIDVDIEVAGEIQALIDALAAHGPVSLVTRSRIRSSRHAWDCERFAGHRLQV